ncbi:SMP-30/gluconolactonase/LRE family protein [Thermodesulfobacteriota bacterium]
MLFLMILIAVTAMALNRRAGLEARISAGQARAVQTRFDQTAVVETAVWELTQNPLWRTAGAGQNYAYNGTTYNRKVLSSAVSGRTDAAVVSVASPVMTRPLRAAYRYYISTPMAISKPNQVAYDDSNNIYYADSDNHSVWKITAGSSALTRVAGSGVRGFAGDNGPAVDARLDTPHGVYADATGNIYIADTNNHRIRKVDTSGDITTFAGTGNDGHSGDGGAATVAELNTPKGIHMDFNGNLYFADSGNHCIRKVDTSGDISTVAGTGGTSGYGGDGGAPTSALLNEPSGVFLLKSGNKVVIIIADTKNHCIRMVNTQDKIITLGGICTQPGYSGDGGLATSAELNTPTAVSYNWGVYNVADTGNHCIRAFEQDSNISTIAGTGVAGYSGDGGAAAAAKLDSPRGVWLKSSNEMIIADTMNGCVRKVDLSSNIDSLTTRNIGLNNAGHIAMDGSGNIYIADSENHRVRRLDASGNVTTIAGNGKANFYGDGGAAVNAALNTPKGVALDEDGNIYIADTGNHCIRKVDTSGDISTVAGIGTQDGYSGNPGFATSSLLDSPEGVAIKNLGGGNVQIYIADTGNHCIRSVNFNGLINTVAGIGTQLGFSGDGGSASSAELNEPMDVFFISDRYYIADAGNHCIRKVDSSGNISTVAGMGTQAGFSGDNGTATAAKLDTPRAVFVDASENIFIADAGNQRIRVVSAGDDNIYTLAGNGLTGFNGEDQPAVDTEFDKPSGIAMAAVRGGLNIYASDTGNNRIRVLNFKMVKEIY